MRLGRPYQPTPLRLDLEENEAQVLLQDLRDLGPATGSMAWILKRLLEEELLGSNTGSL